MAIEHKAFNFDWGAFNRELHGILIDALETNNNGPLKSYIDANVHELTDFALTR